jgi:hypothetical protein
LSASKTSACQTAECSRSPTSKDGDINPPADDAFGCGWFVVKFYLFTQLLSLAAAKHVLISLFWPSDFHVQD